VSDTLALAVGAVSLGLLLILLLLLLGFLLILILFFLLLLLLLLLQDLPLSLQDLLSNRVVTPKLVSSCNRIQQDLDNRVPVCLLEGSVEGTKVNAWLDPGRKGPGPLLDLWSFNKEAGVLDLCSNRKI